MAAIKKTDVVSVQKRAMEAEYQALEAQINEILANEYEQLGGIVLDIGLKGISQKAGVASISKGLREHIIQKYLDAGWNIEFKTSQMDGDYFRFK